MNDITVFNNAEFGSIRTLEIDGAPYWVAIDVAKALGYKDSNKAIKSHCSWGVKHPVTDKLNRERDTYVIPESDLYRLIVHSKLPSAKRFEKWVFEEVLPQLIHKGTYSVSPKESENSELAELTSAVAALREEVAELKNSRTEREYAPPALPMKANTYNNASSKSFQDYRRDLANYLLSTLFDISYKTTSEILCAAYKEMEKTYRINLHAIQREYMEKSREPDCSVFKAICDTPDAYEAFIDILLRYVKLWFQPIWRSSMIDISTW